jgi:chromatin remodeling complex protein RSC6
MEEQMAKQAGRKQKNRAFMKPMRPSEELAKVVGDKPLSNGS